MGTLKDYIAPEQVEGRSEVDAPAQDQYSLACVAFGTA